MRILAAASALFAMVVENEARPQLLITLVDRPAAAAAIHVMFPEHVTVRRAGDRDSEHLYLMTRDNGSDPPIWRRGRDVVEYRRNLPHDIRMLARATSQPDGVLFHYEFVNDSDVAYDMLNAVTDPRMTGALHDARLERTYVHTTRGFELLASQPVRELPARYLASYTWPIPRVLVDRRGDGITYYTKSHKIDAPFIATVSADGKWVVASFTRTTGNVWSNPELTCQHVDPQVPLPPHGTATVEVKILVTHGSLADAYRMMQAQRQSLH